MNWLKLLTISLLFILMSCSDNNDINYNSSILANNIESIESSPFNKESINKNKLLPIWDSLGVVYLRHKKTTKIEKDFIQFLINQDSVDPDWSMMPSMDMQQFTPQQLPPNNPDSFEMIGQWQIDGWYEITRVLIEREYYIPDENAIVFTEETRDRIIEYFDGQFLNENGPDIWEILVPSDRSINLSPKQKLETVANIIMNADSNKFEDKFLTFYTIRRSIIIDEPIYANQPCEECEATAANAQRTGSALGLGNALIWMTAGVLLPGSGPAVIAGRLALGAMGIGTSYEISMFSGRLQAVCNGHTHPDDSDRYYLGDRFDDMGGRMVCDPIYGCESNWP